MKLDFFGLADQCSGDYCDIILLVLIILFVLLFFLIIYYVIRRKLRSLKGKIYDKQRKSFKKKESLHNQIKTIDLFEKKPEKIRKPKIIEKEKKILRISVPRDASRSPSKIIQSKLEIKYLDNTPEIDILKKNSKKDNSIKISNFLINEKLYGERLKKKRRMYADDQSIQYENNSNLSFGSNNNSSIPNFMNFANPQQKYGENHEPKEKFIKIVLFQKEEEQKETKEIITNFTNIRDINVSNQNLKEKSNNISLQIIKFDE